MSLGISDTPAESSEKDAPNRSPYVCSKCVRSDLSKKSVLVKIGIEICIGKDLYW